MKFTNILALVAALPLLASCDLVSTIKANIEDTINQLSQVSKGNLQELVNTNSSTVQEAGQQLQTLKTSSAKPKQGEGTPFSLAPRLFTPMQDEAECPSIVRENDTAAGIRKVTSNYDGCTNGRAGEIVSTLTEDGSSLELNVVFNDYKNSKGLRNGTLKWTIDFVNFADVLISSNEQLTIETQTKTTPPVPVTLETSQTLTFRFKSETSTLTIDGSGNFKDVGGTATLSFASVIFDFSETGCDESPVSGSVKMSDAAGQTLTIEVEQCDKGLQTNPDATTEVLDGDVLGEIFADTLDALEDFFKRLGEVVTSQHQLAACNLDDVVDDNYDADGGNNDHDNAASIVLQDKTFTPPGETGFGRSLAPLTFADEDWFTTQVGNGTYYVVAQPKTYDALWPFVCVYDANEKEISLGCGEFGGWAEFTISGGAKNVFIRVFDPWAEYQCQAYSLDIFDASKYWELPQITEGGGQCPLEWIGDGVCDYSCIDVWGTSAANPGSGVINGDNDGADCVEYDGSGDCPLTWIGDGTCDTACIEGWGASAENPFSTVVNGDNDGGDCDEGNTCPLYYIGDNVPDCDCIPVWISSDVENWFDECGEFDCPSSPYCGE